MEAQRDLGAPKRFKKMVKILKSPLFRIAQKSQRQMQVLARDNPPGSQRCL